MQVNLHNTTGNQFTQYSATSVMLMEQEYKQNIVVTNFEVLPFKQCEVTQLCWDDLVSIVSWAPDLIILGTGDKIVYPDLKLLQQLNTQGIGVEVMTIQALCRTFNFLVSEGRKVTCILFFATI